MRYTINNDVRIKVIEGEAFVYDRSSNLLHSCNRSATYILECLRAQMPVEQLGSSVCEKFETDVKTAESDVMTFLNILEEKKIIALE